MGRIIKLFLDCLSFNTPKARIINYSLIIFASIIISTENLKSFPKLSIWQNFGIPHYSEGLTRGFTRLFKGDLDGALFYNSLTLIVALILITLLLKDLYLIKKKNYFS
jgi:hypothetical protein